MDLIQGLEPESDPFGFHIISVDADPVMNPSNEKNGKFIFFL